MVWKMINYYNSQGSRFQIKRALMWNNQSTGKLMSHLEKHAIDINQTFHKSLL